MLGSKKSPSGDFFFGGSGYMFGEWWFRITRRAGRQDGVDLAETLRQHVTNSSSASSIRDILRENVKREDFETVWLPILMRQLEVCSWSEYEIEKVRAYADFYSGANERGYRRVMDKDLVHADYRLYMTACVACYLADRFQEAVQLLDVFKPEEDPNTEWCEYAAFAGYIHVAAGRSIFGGIAYFDKALQEGEFSPLLAVNAYPIYFEAGCLEQCAHIQRLMHEQCADDPEVIYAQACVELARGYYPEGFRLMEARYRMPEVSLYMNVSVLSRPRWHGLTKGFECLLVHAEQGLGDMLMMARYLPLLHAQGIRLLVDVRPEALSLMQQNFPYCRFITADQKKPIDEPYDCWTGMMSLPYHFSTTATSVPAMDGYLSVPDEQQGYWHRRVRELAVSARLRVGLAWSGNPGHRADKRRSIPFDVLKPLLLDHSDVSFYSLQTQVSNIHQQNLRNVADELLTVADTAAVIAEMDLVISVDTSSVHLAGALGVNTWLLLPYRYEWRWGLEGPHNAWYRSVTVWRQPTNGAWGALLKQVSEALTTYRQMKVR